MEINLPAVFLWISGHVNDLLVQTPISSSTWILKSVVDISEH